MTPAAHFLVTGAVMTGISIYTGRPPTGAEIATAFAFGVAIDIDHFTSLSYILDLPKRGGKGGLPSRNIKGMPTCWLHLWPGLFVSLLVGVYLNAILPGYPMFLPLKMWGIHRLMDASEKSADWLPHISFFYPFTNRRFIPKWLGVIPPKSPAEGFWSAHLHALIIFVAVLLIMLHPQEAAEIILSFRWF